MRETATNEPVLTSHQSYKGLGLVRSENGRVAERLTREVQGLETVQYGEGSKPVGSAPGMRRNIGRPGVPPA